MMCRTSVEHAYGSSPSLKSPLPAAICIAIVNETACMVCFIDHVQQASIVSGTPLHFFSNSFGNLRQRFRFVEEVNQHLFTHAIRTFMHACITTHTEASRTVNDEELSRTRSEASCNCETLGQDG